MQSLTDTLRLPFWTYNVEMIKAINEYIFAFASDLNVSGYRDYRGVPV
jgi:hypothetical protein